MDLTFPQRLAERLTGPLPGPMVGSRFEPSPRLGRHYERIPPDARAAAVLILLYPHEGHWHLPLTVRPEHLPDHPGQISLPGGSIDPGETSAAAALREFHEELGATGHPIRILGGLSPIYVAASRFRVDPHVAVSESRPPMAPSPHEVAELLEVPLFHLLDPDSLDCYERHYQGRPYNAPYFDWHGRRIWGATCMILGELVALLEDLGPVAGDI